ncbi:hypothetical protein [Vibrio litoralis]|nr:hypothetical protein [Vibrio litoralis]
MSRIAQRKLTSKLYNKYINNRFEYYMVVMGSPVRISRAFAKQVFEGAV